MYVRVRQQVSHLASQVIFLFQGNLGRPSDICLTSCCLIWGIGSHCVPTISFATLKGRPTNFLISLLCYLTGWSDWKSITGAHVGHSVIIFRNIFKSGLLNASLKLLHLYWKQGELENENYLFGNLDSAMICMSTNGGSTICSIYFHGQNCPSVIYSRHVSQYPSSFSSFL